MIWRRNAIMLCFMLSCDRMQCLIFGNGMVWDRPGRLFIASKSCWFAQTLAQAFHNVKNFGNAVQVTENRPRALNFQSHQPIIQSRDLSREQCVSFLGAHPGQCVSSVVYAHVYLSNKKICVRVLFDLIRLLTLVTTGDDHLLYHGKVCCTGRMKW